MALQATKENPQALTEAEESLIKKQQKKVEEYLLRNAEALRTWIKSHPNQKPPVYYDDKTDRVVWVNRKQRREMMKKQKQTRMVKPKPTKEVELENDTSN